MFSHRFVWFILCRLLNNCQQKTSTIQYLFLAHTKKKAAKLSAACRWLFYSSHSFFVNLKSTRNEKSFKRLSAKINKSVLYVHQLFPRFHHDARIEFVVKERRVIHAPRLPYQQSFWFFVAFFSASRFFHMKTNTGKLMMHVQRKKKIIL